MNTKNTYTIIGLLVVSIALSLIATSRLENQITELQKSNTIYQNRLTAIEKKQVQLTEDNVKLNGSIDQVDKQIETITTRQVIDAQVLQDLNDKMMKRKK